MNRSSPFSNHAVPEAGAPTVSLQIPYKHAVPEAGAPTVSLQIPYNHAVPEAGTPMPTATNRNEP
jgi:hypothetical protein